MVETVLLLTCLLLTPWLVQFVRHVVKRPEAIPTPTWMVSTTVLFLFLFPFLGAFVSRQPFEASGNAAVKIMVTTILYWIAFTGVYRLASGGARTVYPDGPRGIPTVFGVLKEVAASVTVWRAMVLYVPLVLVNVLFVRSTGLGVSGGGMAMLTLPYHLVVLRLLTQSATSAFTAVFSFHLFGKSSVGTKMAALAGIVTELGFAIVSGRRPVLFALGLVALGSIWSGKRRQAATLLALGLGVWFMAFVFSPIFLRARTIWRSPNSPGIVVAFQRAIQASGEDERLQADSEENINQRMNSYGFWLEFYDRMGSQSLGGTLLIQAIVMNIPRAIAGWAKYAYGATEEAVFGSGDIANNVCLESTIDLGPLGPLVYGVFFGLVFAVMDWLIVWMSRRNKYMALIAIGGVYTFLLSPEADLMGYVGALRQMLMLAVVTVAMVVVFGVRSVVRRSAAPAARFANQPSGLAA